MAKCGSYALQSITASQCLNNAGGIKTVYMIESDLVKAVELGQEADANKIATITLTQPESDKWKKFTFRKGTGSMTSAAEINNENGTLAFTTDVALRFSRATDASRTAIMGMVLDGSVAVVEDTMGHYWYLGKDFPVTASAVGQETGTGFSDFSGYTVNLQDSSTELPRELADEAVQALLAAIAPAPVVA